jgi:hypothetical protein
VSDLPEELSGATEEVSEPAEVWREADGPSWEKVADQGQSAASGSAEPGASPERARADAEDAPAVSQPATEAGRSRRPTSLRGEYVQDSDPVPRRKLSAPAFPSAPSVPGSRWGSPEADRDERAATGEVSDVSATPPAPEPASTTRSANIPNSASLLGKLPKDKIPTDKISMDKLPLDKLPTDKLPLDQLRTLTRQRPEVGLGLAFAGGLLIATILKRLGRR